MVYERDDHVDEAGAEMNVLADFVPFIDLDDPYDDNLVRLAESAAGEVGEEARRRLQDLMAIGADGADDERVDMLGFQVLDP